jgi:S-adenosylmethionine synthetase
VTTEPFDYAHGYGAFSDLISEDKLRCDSGEKNMNYNTFASESVCAGHPDKICDQISDAILDAALREYPKSRVAVETLVTKNRVVIAGEVTCPKKLNFASIARKVIADLGYTKENYGFWYKSPIEVYVHQQSPEISMGVDTGGAGDQGMMFGYATNETPEIMPLPITLAHELARKMDELKAKKLKYLRPDGKSEVAVRYENAKPVRVETIVLANPHDPKIDKEQVKNDLIKYAVKPVLAKYKMDLPEANNLILNGTGKWAQGGPAADTGVTGRKIIVDTYGGMGRIGGGCFSGKDPTKVDRSAAYAARYLAKNIVAAKLADRCEVQLAYVIGYKYPITKAIETFGTGKKSPEKIEKYAWDLLDLSTQGIIEGLKLRRPIYRQTARYGHFGNGNYPWEKIK